MRSRPVLLLFLGDLVVFIAGVWLILHEKFGYTMWTIGVVWVVTRNLIARRWKRRLSAAGSNSD